MAYQQLIKEELEQECGIFLQDEDIYLKVKGTNQYHKKGDIVKLEPTYIKISKNYDVGILNLHNAKYNKHFASSYARIKWALKYGYVPENMEIDHIDLNTHNNNFDNLRLISKVENLRNKKAKHNQYTIEWTDEERKEYFMKKEKQQNYKVMKIKLKNDIIDLEAKLAATKIDLKNAKEALVFLKKQYKEEMK